MTVGSTSENFKKLLEQCPRDNFKLAGRIHFSWKPVECGNYSLMVSLQLGCLVM